MKEQFLTFFTGIISATFILYVTYLFSNKKQKNDILREQKHRYFSPFKDSCIDFLSRLQHIEQRLFEKKMGMSAHFNQTFENKDINWCFTDWKDINNTLPGGYFITSTIYMNCILYSKIKLIQQEYPFITIRLKKNLHEIVTKSGNVQINRCFNEIEKKKSDKEYERLWKTINDLFLRKNKIKLRQMIVSIRNPTSMRNGIPYALHNSFGDFVMDNKETINYLKFSKLIIDSTEGIKFMPLIIFWTKLINDDGESNDLVLNKIRGLILILKLVEYSELK